MIAASTTDSGETVLFFFFPSVFGMPLNRLCSASLLFGNKCAGRPIAQRGISRLHLVHQTLVLVPSRFLFVRRAVD